MKKYKEQILIGIIIIIAIVIGGYFYSMNNKIQTTPYEPTPSPVQATSGGGSGGTASSATSPSVSPQASSNNSGSSTVTQPTIAPTTGVNNNQPTNTNIQQAEATPLVSSQPAQ